MAVALCNINGSLPILHPPLFSFRSLNTTKLRCFPRKPQCSTILHKDPKIFPVHFEQKLEELRQSLKIRCGEDDEDVIESLMIIDAIRRWGIDKYYAKEIHTILSNHYLKTKDNIHQHSSLYHVSLSFKLLRQRGYHVPADVFDRFKDKEGKFKQELMQDIDGLMELYEATQLSFEGESILDEAEEFSSKVLRKYCKWTDNIRTSRLRHPYHHKRNFQKDTKSMDDCTWKRSLRELVEMDFHMQQSLYQDELVQVFKWWDEVNLIRELPLARDQPLKWYTWSMTILVGDSSLSMQRNLLTKSIAFIYLLDDMFDLYGTLDELTVFTEAIERWDNAAVDMLPNYMKRCYTALLHNTDEISNMIYEMHGHNPINHLKQMWMSLCKAFLVEAKWFASANLPMAEEYLENGKVSSGVHVVMAHLFFLLGLGRPCNQTSIHLKDASTIISTVATILRLWDDLGSAKDEHQDGTDGSYIACYMKDHPHVSVEQAKEHVKKMIATEWKLLNKECFHLGNSPFQEATLNFARMIPLMYSYDDNQRLPILDEHVNFFFPNECP